MNINLPSFKGFKKISYLITDGTLKSIEVTATNDYGKNDFDEFKSLAFEVKEKDKEADISFAHVDKKYPELDLTCDQFTTLDHDLKSYIDKDDSSIEVENKIKKISMVKKLMDRIIEAKPEEFEYHHDLKKETEKLKKENPMVLFDDKAEKEYLDKKSEEFNKFDYKDEDVEVNSVATFDIIPKFKKEAQSIKDILDKKLQEMCENF